MPTSHSADPSSLRQAIDCGMAGMPVAVSDFSVPGGRAIVCAPGVIVLRPDTARPGVAATVISVGIHGNETAPIELLQGVADRLDAGQVRLGAPVLLVVGHPAAIAAGQRYCETNLNRLFERDAGAASSSRLEDVRAAELMAAVDVFWQEYATPSDPHAPGAAGVPLHLDLHTAIRGSRYPRFAVEPFSDTPTPALLWPVLAGAGLQAVLLQHRHSWTFSHYSRHYHQVPAFTLELGKVAPFGDNDLQALASMSRLLCARLAGQPAAEASPEALVFFRVHQELLRESDQFSLAFADDTPNFTAFDVGTLIARDPARGDTVVTDAPLHVVFPNADVERGARAALLVRPTAPPGG